MRFQTHSSFHYIHLFLLHILSLYIMCTVPTGKNITTGSTKNPFRIPALAHFLSLLHVFALLVFYASIDGFLSLDDHFSGVWQIY